MAGVGCPQHRLTTVLTGRTTFCPALRICFETSFSYGDGRPPNNFVPSSSVPEPPVSWKREKEKKSPNYSPTNPFIFLERTNFRMERTQPSPPSLFFSIQLLILRTSSAHAKRVYSSCYTHHRHRRRGWFQSGGARFFSATGRRCTHGCVPCGGRRSCDTFVTLYAPRSSRERSSGLSGLM